MRKNTPLPAPKSGLPDAFAFEDPDTYALVEVQWLDLIYLRYLLAGHAQVISEAEFSAEPKSPKTIALRWLIRAGLAKSEKCKHTGDYKIVATQAAKTASVQLLDGPVPYEACAEFKERDISPAACKKYLRGYGGKPVDSAAARKRKYGFPDDVGEKRFMKESTVLAFAYAPENKAGITDNTPVPDGEEFQFSSWAVSCWYADRFAVDNHLTPAIYTTFHNRSR